MDKSTLSAWLPLVVIAVVFALRFRNISKPKPFRPGMLWVLPVILTIVFGLIIFSMPPTVFGWLAMAIGAMVGAAIGWKRGHLMHLDRDPATGQLQMRQSPAGLVLILGVLFAKRLIGTLAGIDPAASAGSGGAIPSGALIFTDAMLGMALGMVIVMRLTLWQRVEDVPHHQAG